MEFVLRSDWTSERYASLISLLEQTVDSNNYDEVALSWEGRQPSLWQLVWIAECIRQLKNAGICWHWKSSGERAVPAWLDAGGLLGAGGITKHL